VCVCVCVGTRLLGLNLRWRLHVPSGLGDKKGDEWEENHEKTTENLRNDKKKIDEYNRRRQRQGKRVRTGGEELEWAGSGKLERHIGGGPEEEEEVVEEEEEEEEEEGQQQQQQQQPGVSLGGRGRERQIDRVE
jgi:hypothetical protein